MMNRYDFLDVPANEQVALYLYGLIVSMETGKRRHMASRYELYRAMLLSYGIQPEEVFGTSLAKLLRVEDAIDPWEEGARVTTDNWREEAALVIKQIGPNLRWEEEAFLKTISHANELIPFELTWLDALARRRLQHTLRMAEQGSASPDFVTPAPSSSVQLSFADYPDDDVPF